MELKMDKLVNIEALIEQEIQKKAKEIINKEVEDYISSWDIEEFIEEYIEKIFENKFALNDDTLEDMIIKATKKEMFKWYEINLTEEDILDCLKQSLIEKFSELNLEEIVKMISTIK